MWVLFGIKNACLIKVVDDGNLSDTGEIYEFVSEEEEQQAKPEETASKADTSKKVAAKTNVSSGSRLRHQSSPDFRVGTSTSASVDFVSSAVGIQKNKLVNGSHDGVKTEVRGKKIQDG